MNKTIHIREAVTPEEVERFWQELHAYHARDISPTRRRRTGHIFWTTANTGPPYSGSMTGKGIAVTTCCFGGRAGISALP